MDTVKVQKVKTSKGGNAVLINDGYYCLYVNLCKSDTTITIYECAERKKNNCKYRVHIRETTIIKEIGNHEHEPSKTLCKIVYYQF